MSGGDKMRNGAEPTAVRVLPVDGIHSLEPQVPPESGEHHRRWPVLIAGLGIALLFLAATRPATESDAAPAPTTTPPALAAVDAEVIDLRPKALVAATEDWETATFDGSSQIEEIVSFNSSMIAIGSTPTGAQAWLSSTGLAWRAVPRLELPETAKSSLDLAVVWKGDIVALGSVDSGVGLWTAGTLSHWVYHGQVEAMGSKWPTALVAGSKLLAISETEGQLEGWTSTDGFSWTSTGHFQGLDLVGARAFAATEDWYFIGGVEDCDGQNCRPVIYRSQNAITWEPVDGALRGVLSIERGKIVDITATTDGLTAVGWLGPPIDTPATEVAVWTSSDGATWSRVAEDEPLLQPASVTIELVDLDSRSDRIANVLVDGKPYRLVENSEVATRAGTFRVTGLGPPRVAIQMDGRSSFLLPGEPVTVDRGVIPSRVAVEGPRIVITGFFFGSNAPRPVIWSSADHGRTWDMTEPGTAEAGDAGAVALLRRRIAVAGSTESGGAVWTSQWDTRAAEAAGVETMEDYIAAINDRDVAALAALLPHNTEGTVTPEFQIPSLGEVDLPWWQEDRSRLDIDSIGETFEYLNALHTDMSISDCRTTMSLGATDILRIACEVEVTSDLLAVLSPDSTTGRIEGILTDGTLSSVSLLGAPSEPAWQMLTTGTTGTTEADRATLVSKGSRGRTVFSPTFTKESADVHLRLATAFVSSLLRPGDTKMVETLFGTMEWTWFETMPAPVYGFSWITHTETGFVAIGREPFDDTTPQVSLWSSPNGLDWDEIPAPEGIESMGQLQVFRDGLAAPGWREDESTLLVFDGTAWTEVTFPAPYDSGSGGVSRMAISGDQMLVLTQTWEHEDPGNRQAWLVGSDLTLRRTTLPADPLASYGPLGIVGSDNGFVIAEARGDRGDNLSVWHSKDGVSWTQIAESASIDDAQYVWNLEQHRNKYFVVGQSLETRCSTTSDSVEICQELIGLWTSPDGVAWDRLVTNTGTPLASYEIASGPLGLAAIGEGFYEITLPRPLYFSTDAETWEHSTSLSLHHPDATWWANRPAVGTDTIIITGSSYNESPGGIDRDVPFLIVGRVIDSRSR